MAKKPTRNEKDRRRVEEKFASMHYNGFLRTRSPLDAFTSLDTFLTLGINPPPELLDFFNQVFKKYVSHKGEKSLDKCFGLVLLGKGQRNLFTQREQQWRDFNLCETVWLLKTCFDLNSEEAAHAVSQLPDSLAQETIADRWKKNKEWKAIRKDMDTEKKEDQLWWDKDFQNWFLSRFPVTAFPKKIQKIHPYYPDDEYVAPLKLSFAPGQILPPK